MGNKCKFSHDLSQQDKTAASKATSEKVVKIPLKVASPARLQKEHVEGDSNSVATNITQDSNEEANAIGKGVY